jgi:hypothetical protein
MSDWSDRETWAAHARAAAAASAWEQTSHRFADYATPAEAAALLTLVRHEWRSLGLAS